MTDNQQEKKEKRKSFAWLYITLILLLAGTSGWLGWQYAEQKKAIAEGIKANEILEGERDKVKSELEDIIAQYDSLIVTNGDLSEELLAKKTEAEELLGKVNAHKYEAFKYKKEAATLRKIMKSYVHTIDSLNTANIHLKEEKKAALAKIETQQEQYQQLEQVKEGLADKVKIGSRLQTKNISVIAQRVKKNTMHRETTKADRTDKIKCCFTLEKNEIAKSGKKFVYLRIIAPNAKVLHENEEDKFDFNGINGHYSLKKEVDYQNTEQNLCVYWEVSEPLIPGDYIVEVYADEADIGKVTLSLK
ncbi:MAG: hypothetical protein COA57_01305 [Flavobacteriales bacterium]|nr:MAG: hypothetical protein COA57_01305 [Flavobacteriales bacterium]